MKNVLKVTFVIIGTIIGAGFASGREIYLFFNMYGKNGLYGIIVSSILTGIIVYKVFSMMQVVEIFNYDNFIKELLKTSKKYKNINIIRFIKGIIDVFLLLSFYIMIAGFSAYFKQEFNIPVYQSSTVIAIICYLIFSKDVKGIMAANIILIPVLIIFILVIGIKNIPYLMNNIAINGAEYARIS